MWATDESIDDPGDLMDRLHDAYSETGLWPMLVEERFSSRWPDEFAGHPSDEPTQTAEDYLYAEWASNYGPRRDPDYDDEWDDAFRPWGGLRTPADPGSATDLTVPEVARVMRSPGRVVLVPAPAPRTSSSLWGPIASTVARRHRRPQPCCALGATGSG